MVVLGAPGRHLLQYRLQVLTFLSEAIFGAGWHLGETLAGDDTLSFEVVEALAERARVNVAHGFFELAEPLRASEQISQNQSCPLVANNVHSAGNTADLRLERLDNSGSFHTLQSIVMALY